MFHSIPVSVQTPGGDYPGSWVCSVMGAREWLLGDMGAVNQESENKFQRLRIQRMSDCDLKAVIYEFTGPYG